MLTDWIEVSTGVSETLEDSPIWNYAWYKKDHGFTVTADGVAIYILRVAHWHPDVEMCGKIFIHAGGGFTIRQAPEIPGTKVPHMFDDIDEAKAAYDLIVDKELV